MISVMIPNQLKGQESSIHTNCGVGCGGVWCRRMSCSGGGCGKVNNYVS